MNLTNAKILITGGSSGLGKSMAQVLTNAGADVLITGRDEAKVNQVATEIGCKGLAFDVSNYSELEDNATEAVRLLDGIDV